MAAPASDARTGFGPGATVRIPVFDGKRENFQIFELCLKTASMSLGLDALLLRPEEFEEQISQARARTRSRTAASSAQADSAAQTGFGPGASVRADRMIPVFDGKRENFQIFELSATQTDTC